MDMSDRAEDQESLPISENSGSESNIVSSSEESNCLLWQLSLNQKIRARSPDGHDLNYSGKLADSTNNPLPSEKVSRETNSELSGSPDSLKISQDCRLKKRSLDGSSYEIKAKRLRTYYNYEYRDILNSEIQQAASKVSLDDIYKFQDSQIGSSIWAAGEKAFFFTALDTLGKDNVREISQRIGTKSELEVREYLLTLQDHYHAKIDSSTLCTMLDVPSAIEISEECCGLLERAGDAIAARQESTEVNKEKEKWDVIWLINDDVCREITQSRNNLDNPKYLEDFKPVADFFNLRTWLQLSRRIFMNSSLPGKDNWKILAEPEETPAIRATAFEDFYSLAVSLIKRLISASLFFTMSRMRAKSLIRASQPEINTDDVRAAIKTLGLRSNNDEFWIGCARRCDLYVINDTENSLQEIKNRSTLAPKMSYDKLEEIMAAYGRPESKIKCDFSGTSNQRSLIAEEKDKGVGYNDDTYDSDETTVNSRADESSDDCSAPDPMPPTGEGLRKIKKFEKHKSAMEAQDLYVDSMDIRASQTEEIKFWKMLKEKPPFDINISEVPAPPVPKFIQDSREGEDWRDYLEHYSEWEILEAQVPEEKFALNRVKSVKSMKNMSFSQVNEDDVDPDEQVKEKEKNYEQCKHFRHGEGPNLSISTYEYFSDHSVFSDEIMTQLRGLAANFQPSSREDDDEEWEEKISSLD